MLCTAIAMTNTEFFEKMKARTSMELAKKLAKEEEEWKRQERKRKEEAESLSSSLSAALSVSSSSSSTNVSEAELPLSPPAADRTWFSSTGEGVSEDFVRGAVELTARENNYHFPPEYRFDSVSITSDGNVILQFSRPLPRPTTLPASAHVIAHEISRLEREKEAAISAREYSRLEQLDEEIRQKREVEKGVIEESEEEKKRRMEEIVMKSFVGWVPTCRGMFVYGKSSMSSLPVPLKMCGTPFVAVGVAKKLE